MKYYKYAGNPSCGCCDDPCPSITINRCNFNEFCTTSGEEWFERDYGTQARPDKRCELWYTQSATITIKSDKIKAVEDSVWIYDFDNFYANAWDAKPPTGHENTQTRADGDTFVQTSTIAFGSHTVVYSIVSEWIYNTSNAAYDKTTRIGVYIDNNLCWTDELEYRGDSSSEPSYTFDIILFRRGNFIDVYTNSGHCWVGSFAYSSAYHFAYEFHAEYTGTTKYLLVSPNLTWKTVKYKPDPGCVYYPPGALTQAQKNDIEERQRLSFEDNPACEYTSGTLCPVFSPPFGIQLSGVPSEYSSCPTIYCPVYIQPGASNYNWNIQKMSYCMDSGIARRINLGVSYESPVRAVNNCSEFPYGFTIDYWEYATDSAGLSIVTAPQYGTASIVEEVDGNNEVYIRRIRYTAPSTLPTGTCIDWLEYQLTGKYGETSRGVLKFKLYPEDYTQDSIWEEYLTSPGYGSVEDSDYWQDVLKLIIEGEWANVGDSSGETQWHVELFGLLPHGHLHFNDLLNVNFSFIDGISYWYYQCGNIGELNDSVNSNGSIQNYIAWGLEQCYYDAKAMLEAITAQITTSVASRGSKFIVSNNNIIDSCSSQQIESTTTTVSVKLVKTRVYTVSTGFGSTTTRTEIDSQQLQNQTLVLDWGISPEESPLGLAIPGDQSLPDIDVSQYSSRFNINSVPLSVRIRIGQIIAKTYPENGVLWEGNSQSGTTPENYSWWSFDRVEAKIQTSTSITYF